MAIGHDVFVKVDHIMHLVEGTCASNGALETNPKLSLAGTAREPHKSGELRMSHDSKPAAGKVKSNDKRRPRIRVDDG
jgi:hypothetical protein